MKSVGVLLLLAALVTPEPKPDAHYFQDAREIHITALDHQNYFVVDPAIWAHAKPNLADLRIYSGDVQVPYALTAEASTAALEQHEAPILNLGAAGSETQFDLDMTGLAEYDRVQLRLSATNFVASASIDGRDSLSDAKSTHLATSTIYDFSKERLGSSFVLRMPASTFHYLHIRINGSVEPQQVLAAEISFRHEAQAVWASAGHCGSLEQRERESLLTCRLLPGAPLARLLFTVPSESYNFRRTVTVSDDRDVPLVRSSISRIRMDKAQARPPVLADDLVMAVPCGACQTGATTLRIAVDNGDDTPLAGLEIEPQALERRVYFDPEGHSDLELYYADAKLGAPVYDYAKFFKQADDATLAQLGAEAANTLYRPRPDERPWSERHPAVLWATMIVAVVVLAGFAVRGIMGASSAKAG